LLRATNILDSNITTEGVVYVTEDRIGTAQYVQRWDVVIAMSSGSRRAVGKLAQMTNEWSGSFGAFCGVLRPNPQLIDLAYFGFVLQSRAFRDRIELMAQGTNIKNLSKQHLLGFSFNAPDMDEQRRIVRILTAIQRAQEALDGVAATTSRIKAAALQEVFGGDDGLPRQRIADVAQVRTSFPMPARLTPSSIDDADHMLYLKVSDIGRSLNPIVSSATAVFTKTDKALGVGATVFPKRGGAIGTNVKRMVGRPAVLDPNLIGVEPGSELLPRFLLGFFESIDLRDLQDNTPIPQLNKRNVDVLPIPVPPLTTQTEACRLLDALDAKASADRTLKLSLSAVFQSALAHLIEGAP
jgi:type I restriction enzyme S subunit